MLTGWQESNSYEFCRNSPLTYPLSIKLLPVGSENVFSEQSVHLWSATHGVTNLSATHFWMHLSHASLMKVRRFSLSAYLLNGSCGSFVPGEREDREDGGGVLGVLSSEEGCV
jgi:hypothetical protein